MGELLGSDSLREDLMLVGVSGGMVLTHFPWSETKTHINLIETQTPVKPPDSAEVSRGGKLAEPLMTDSAAKAL